MCLSALLDHSYWPVKLLPQLRQRTIEALELLYSVNIRSNKVKQIL